MLDVFRGLSFDLPFGLADAFVPRKAPPVNILHKGGRALKTVATHGVTAVAAVAVAALVYWKIRRDRKHNGLREAKARAARLDTVIAAGCVYAPRLRDCVEGETHDVVVEEDATDDDEGDEGPPGLARRGPALRRIARRKKMVHEVYSDGMGTVSGPFLGDVIAQARNIYNGGSSDVYHRQLARSFMVRLMTAAGMRPFHINHNIDRMVCCVFRKTSVQVEAAADWEAMRMLGDVKDEGDY